MSGKPTLLWFRTDLRLTDNPALHSIIQSGTPGVPVFIWSPEEELPWAPASATRWWLHQSLAALQQQLHTIGSKLILRTGPSLQTLRDLAKETGATAIHWNRRYEPSVIQRDSEIKKALRSEGYIVESFNASLLFEPWDVQTKQKNPYQVYTPFWNACKNGPPPEKPIPSPRSLKAPEKWPSSIPLASLQLEPTIDWADGIRKAWIPGEHGAEQRLDRFLKEAINEYAEQRDRPDMAGTSSLSPYLHFGEISPRTIWHRICDTFGSVSKLAKGPEVYLKELVWREFAHHLLYHFPHTTDEPLREEFTAFPWRKDPKSLRAWQKGKTGYPFVDAGMRQLWTTGWMHNRVRMVVASFLVKHLLISWREGAKWFWDTLVDADLASNTLGWQWTAGCGADAAPYFRIFNPIGQGEKFDPDGKYIRQWVPELTKLPNKFLHQPWEAPKAVLLEANVELGKSYPYPIVDHSDARTRALEALASISKTKK